VLIKYDKILITEKAFTTPIFLTSSLLRSIRLKNQ